MNKKEAIDYINTLPDDANISVETLSNLVSSKEVEALGISRQLLKYHVKAGHIRTIPYGKQKKYLLADVLKIKK